MLQNINIEEIKKYNASLKEQREKAASLKAQIDYTEKELEQLCKELSTELGVEVNKSNIEQIYNDELNKINSTLQSGNAVLAKIVSEGNAVANGQVQSNVASTPSINNTAVMQNNVPNMTPPVAPVAPSVAPVAQPQIPSGQVAGQVFGSNQPQQLPPLFNI